MLETLKNLIDWLGTSERRAAIGWIGGGVVIVVAGLWGVFGGSDPKPSTASSKPGGTSIEIKRDNNGVVIGGDAGTVNMPAPAPPKAESK